VPQLLIALAILFIAWQAMRLFARTPPAVLARYIRNATGVSALGAGVLFLLRGSFPLAAAAGAIGAYMLGIGRFPRGFRSAGEAGPMSRVRSAMIEMELDHATGSMRGTILAGPQEGRSLDSLTRPACEALYAQCLTDDPDGARLLEAYLDRRFPGWRQAGQGQGDAGGAGSRGRSRRDAAMSEDEAYEVLGLRKGASREDVSRAHRSLMKKLHPDQGGSTDLAARVNEAKDVLMRRHT
jgi:hypothetical protein